MKHKTKFELSINLLITLVISAVILIGGYLKVGWAEQSIAEQKLSGIEEVKARYASLLMDIPGVVGVGIGRCDGEPCIKVLLEKETEESKRIPRELQGFKVVTEVVGVIEARPPIQPLPAPNPTPTPIIVTENADTVGRYGIYELTIQHDDAAYANPWEQVTVTAYFATLYGKIYSIDGFYYNIDQWKVRFSPPKVGKWTWKLAFTTPTKVFTNTGSFSVTPSTYPGFVRQHPTNPYRLVFQDASLFNAIGIGDCIPLDTSNWSMDGGFRTDSHYKHGGHRVEMKTYLRAYGDSGSGFNLFRWNPGNCAFKLYDTISPNGNRYLIKEGIVGDELVEALRENGFRIWLTFFNKPPYPNAVGNPAEEDAIKRYIRYVVARYAAYVDIWELANEVVPVGFAEWKEYEVPDNWLIFVSNYLRSIDPHKRMITNSYPRARDWNYLDIRSPHWYEKESEFESDLRTSQQIAAYKRENKPVIFGEQGNSIQNWDSRSALRMRLRSWTAFFEEGTLIFWNSSFAKDYLSPVAANIYLGPEERKYIRILQDFTADIDANVQKITITPTDPTSVRAYGLQSSKTILAYFHHFTDHTNSVNTIVTLNVSFDGTVTWIDPATGNIIQSSTIKNGTQTLTTPNFIVDLALKIVITHS